MLSSSMKDLSIRFAIVAVAITCLDYGTAQSHDKDTTNGSPSKQEQKWKMTAMGELGAHDGSSLSLRSYTKKDGKTVTIVHGDFSSDAEAIEELNHAVKAANKIVDRQSLKDDNGKTVGERILAVFMQNEPKEELQSVLWTEGSTFWDVSSPSLSVTLEWEKKISRYVPKPQSN